MECNGKGHEILALNSLPEKGNTAVDVIWPFEILGRELEVFRDKKVALLCRPSSGNTKF